MWLLTSGMRCFMYMALVHTSLKNQEAIGDQTMPYGKCEVCTCYDEKGKVYNLLPLQEDDSDRPSFWTSKDGYKFSYSPCRPFKLKGPCQDDVAVCRSNSWEAEPSYEKLGEISGMALGYDNNFELPELTYPLKDPSFGKEWQPKVLLNCDPGVTGKATFSTVDVDNEYKFKLTHQCLCPDADCKEQDGPTEDENNHLLEIVVPVSAVGAFLAIVGLLIWRRHKTRNERQRLCDLGDNSDYQSVAEFINPTKKSGNRKFQNNTQPLPVSSSLYGDIEGSKKDDFNNLSALHSISLSPSKTSVTFD